MAFILRSSEYLRQMGNFVLLCELDKLNTSLR